MTAVMMTLTTCTTFNTGPQVINSHSVLKHLTLPLGRNNGMALFANKSNSNFPFQECVVLKGQATSTVDHLFLRPGENRLDKHPQNPWEAIHGCETGMPLMTSWPKDGYSQRIRDPLITIHGILDPWCQYNCYDHFIFKPISCFLLWCLFNSHGPKTLWLLLTPSQDRPSFMAV
jgi:hypothetical protein